ncbi:hypothetical protein NDN08_000012 [Rhodosorus marinus]|uniref:Protein kinase domain-containing protein n=1 Tax=Rhodosorus marinus TaxID=101924 RepID=A0AAV8UE45_9RHOD|nr:hypothetical protein NDN08_000012 [Rhodosorus marinus]
MGDGEVIYRHGESPLISGDLITDKSSGKSRYFILRDSVLYKKRSKVHPEIWSRSILGSNVNSNLDLKRIQLQLRDGRAVDLYPPTRESFEAWTAKLRKGSQRSFDRFYNTGRSIGRGSYGQVWLGIDKRDSYQVAVKRLEKRSKKGERNAAIERELAFLNREIRCSKIVRILDVFESVKELVVVTEYMRGGCLLSDVLKEEKRLSEEKAAMVMRDLLQALDCLQENGVIHRDVKPENLLAERREWPTVMKLTDFGLAHVMERPEEHVHEQLGSALFAAPEIAMGRTYGPEVDIWSAGIVLYNMLSGEFPFTSRSKETLLKKIQSTSGQVVFEETNWSHVSPPCMDLLRRMLNPDPVHRITAKEALESLWLKTMSAEPSASVGAVIK